MAGPETTDPDGLQPLPTSHWPPSYSRRFSLAAGPQSPQPDMSRETTRKKALLYGAAIICLAAAVNWAWFWAFWEIDHDRDPSMLLMNVAIWPAIGLAALCALCVRESARMGTR